MIACPHCRYSFDVSSEKAGEVVACPKCSGAISLPADREILRELRAIHQELSDLRWYAGVAFLVYIVIPIVGLVLLFGRLP